MNRSMTTILIVLASLVCSNAIAVKQRVYVSPNETTFRVEQQQEDRMVGFTIIRDPADARTPRNELILVRIARLVISDGKRTLMTAPIAPHVRNDGKLVYVFRISEEHAPHSVFTISEIEDTRNRSGYMGDGTIFEYTMNGNSAIRKAMRRFLGSDGSLDDK